MHLISYIILWLKSSVLTIIIITLLQIILAVHSLDRLILIKNSLIIYLLNFWLASIRDFWFKWPINFMTQLIHWCIFLQSEIQPYWNNFHRWLLLPFVLLHIVLLIIWYLSNITIIILISLCLIIWLYLFFHSP